MPGNLPARLGSRELMPPETYLRPGRVSRFLLVYIGLVFTLVAAILLLIWVPGFPWLSALLSLGVIGTAFGARRRFSKASEANQRGVNLLNAGELDEAARIFEELARTRKSHYGHVVYVYNVAVAALLQGRHQRALSIFNAVDASGRLRRPFLRNLEPNLYIEMGCCLALCGDVAAAEVQLERASRLLQPPEDGRLLFLEAVIAVRKHQFQWAADRIDQQWRRAEGALRGPTLRTLRLVHAFALAHIGEAKTRKFDLLVAGATPSRPSDFHWATCAWPEFEEFVRTTLP